jgi:hypothetical protein
LVLQSSLFDGLALDPFAFEENGAAASEVDVGGGEVLQALVVALVVVTLRPSFIQV